MARTSNNIKRTVGMKAFAQLRSITGMSQKEFAKHYGIPERNIQNWESRNQMPEYAFKMYAFKIYNDYAGTILSDEQLDEMVKNWDNPYSEGTYTVERNVGGCTVKELAQWDGNSWSVDGVSSWDVE